MYMYVMYVYTCMRYFGFGQTAKFNSSKYYFQVLLITAALSFISPQLALCLQRELQNQHTAVCDIMQVAASVSLSLWWFVNCMD